MDIAQLEKDTGEFVDIVCKDIDYRESFTQLCQKFAPLSGTVVLLSGNEHECSRYNILATRPWICFTAKGKNINLQTENNSYRFSGDSLEALRQICRLYSLHSLDLPTPVASGLFGYFAYDLKDQIEDLPRTSLDDLHLPDLCLYAPSLLLVQDNFRQHRKLYLPVFHKNGKSTSVNYYMQLFNQTRNTEPPVQNAQTPVNGKQFRSNFQKSEYVETVDRIREYIKSGHIYQINLSQRFHLDFNGDPFDLFTHLFNQNPAPFYAYINAGSHQVLSTSPERFLYKSADLVETRPIKGTRPRGTGLKQDREYANQLLSSSKDDAELSMIVDLLRNDLGKCCKPGTVKVQEHKRLEKYHNVFHLVSIVQGKLDKGIESADLLRASFPGGSITGCPKIRAMQIIDELEPNRRHVYTGSIGYVSFQGNMDLSIAIRTATVYNGKILFSVGGGVVFDSDPQEEYEETLHKGRTLMHFFQGEEKEHRSQKVWLNGKIIPEEEAWISPLSSGFQYGFGFFETLRVEKGKPLYLQEHINRLYNSWKQYFPENFPDLSWDLLIDQLIRENQLLDRTAAVKILVSRGRRRTPPVDNTILITATPYVHRLVQKNAPALLLRTYPEPRLSPLAKHKSQNYLYYFTAGNWAKQNGADEALILNPDGSISETNTGNILLLSGEKIIVPASRHVLPGIMQQKALKLLRNLGYNVKEQTVYPEQISRQDSLLLSNSLMGVVAVSQIDEKPLPIDPEFCSQLNRELLKT